MFILQVLKCMVWRYDG